MNWAQAIDNIKFTVKTGDGKTWTPLLVPKYNQEIEYNGQRYELVNRMGTVFPRQLPKGRVFELEFAFTGPDNKSYSRNFALSANDRRAWTVSHPFYGQIIGSPLSLKINDTPLSSSIISCSLLETVRPSTDRVKIQKTREYVKGLIVETEYTLSMQCQTDGNPQNLARASGLLGVIFDFISKIASAHAEFKQIKAKMSYAVNAMNNAYGLKLGALAAIQSTISAPATLAIDLGTRMRVLSQMSANLRVSMKSILTPGYFDRLLHFIFGVSITRAMCTACLNPVKGDTDTRDKVLLFIDKLKKEYDLFVQDMYEYETDEFSVNADVMAGLHDVVFSTLEVLNAELESAKMRRVYVTEGNTNVILLAYRLYHDTSDESIEKVISHNKIGLDEIMLIKPERDIVYYV